MLRNMVTNNVAEVTELIESKGLPERGERYHNEKYAQDRIGGLPQRGQVDSF
jgi:hypothetical protein